MKLTLNEIKSITFGAVNIREEDGAIRFYRMTERQTEAFIREAADFGMKARATAGIRFDFYTDASFVKINLAKRILAASSRKFCSFDVLLNGTLYMHFLTKNIDQDIPDDIYIPLNGKENRIQVFFANLAAPGVTGVEISDGAFIRPAEPQMKILCYGDSITQGYDSLYSSAAYVNIMAQKLDAEVFNQAIGGAKFNSEIIEALPCTPDIITVAYGTNDWHGRERSRFVSDTKAFLDRLAEVYGGVKTFIILPIWRADCDRITNAGNFFECRQVIASLAEEHGFRVIDDIDLVAHDPRLFSDLYLHPNDLGFALYGDGLAKKILAE